MKRASGASRAPPGTRVGLDPLLAPPPALPRHAMSFESAPQAAFRSTPRRPTGALQRLALNPSATRRIVLPSESRIANSARTCAGYACRYDECAWKRQHATGPLQARGS